MANYFFVRDDVPVDSETLLMVNFINLEIKPTQSFKNDHKDKIHIHVFIGVSAHTYINICVYIIFLKKERSYQARQLPSRSQPVD
jgi:hypothetical protein